tara:strand:+ start:360 stop:1250 length:891 start_codon:yes stop_codon:yes gene_type:complete
MKKNFLTLLTRVRNENLFLEAFVKHYFAEGVDEIHILDDHSTEPYPEYVANHPKVFVYESENWAKHGIPLMDARLMYDNLLRESTEWFMFVDADEFMTVRRNTDKTIREELETTFKDADLIKVPWLLFGSNGKDRNPKQVLTETTWRWDHDKRHPHSDEFMNIWPHRGCKYDRIEVKSIFKTDSFSRLNTHSPGDATKKVNIVDGVDNISNYMNENEDEIWYHNLREECIERAYLIINHYRNISKEQMKQKADNSHMPNYKVNNCYELQLESDFSEIEDNFIKNIAIKRGYYEKNK